MSDVPPTVVSFIFVLTLTETGLFPVVVTVLDGLGDPVAQSIWYFVTAAPLDEGSNVSLEVERLEARRALVQMAADLDPPLSRQLAIEVVVEPVDRLFAVGAGAAIGSVCAERSEG